MDEEAVDYVASQILCSTLLGALNSAEGYEYFDGPGTGLTKGDLPELRRLIRVLQDHAIYHSGYSAEHGALLKMVDRIGTEYFQHVQAAQDQIIAAVPDLGYGSR